MLHEMVRNWWILALRGLGAVIFGIMALSWPRLTIGVLVILFGAYSLVDGIFALITAVQQRQNLGPLLVEGIAGIGAGIVAFLWPGITALALLYLIAAWAIVTGVFELIAAFRLRRSLAGEFLLGLSGVVSLVFGLLLMARPGAGALAVVGLIAAYSLVFGVILLALGFRLHALQKHPGAAGVDESSHGGVRV